MKLNFRPKDGDKVRCTGSLSVYAPQGNYQIIVNTMEIAGAGNILQMLEERKRKLAAEGHTKHCFVDKSFNPMSLKRKYPDYYAKLKENVTITD